MKSWVASDLSGGPFTVETARSYGLTWKNLQGRSFRRLSHGQYALARLPHDVELRLAAVQQRLPSAAAFSGPTAGWLLGLDLAPCEPIEVTVERDVPIRARAGVRLRRAALPESEIAVRRGFRLTDPMRTARDLGSRRDLGESVVALDMVLHAGLVDVGRLAKYVHANRGTKGIKRLRHALALANGRTESPMETRLRLELIMAGLPTPCVQIDLHDGAGAFLGRADLYYPDVKLVIEFDGQNHKDRLAADVRRQNALVNAGYHVLRFTAGDLRAGGPVVAHVRHALNSLARPGR